MTTPPAPAEPGSGELMVMVCGEAPPRWREWPAVAVDGQPLPAKPGVNRYPVLAGQHLVRVQMDRSAGRRSYGGADQTLWVHPGATTEIYYAPPAWRPLAGRLGSEPQLQAGRDALLLLLGGMLGFVVGIGFTILLMLFYSGSSG